MQGIPAAEGMDRPLLLRLCTPRIKSNSGGTTLFIAVLERLDPPGSHAPLQAALSIVLLLNPS